MSGQTDNPARFTPGEPMGYLFAALATLIWSGNYIVARGLSGQVTPCVLALSRWVVAALFLLPLAWPSLIRERAILRAHWRYLFWTALIGVTAFNTLVYLAGRYTSALNLTLIATFSPVFIVAISRFAYGDRITPRRIVGLAAAFVGVVILITKGNLGLLLKLELNIGDLWMLLAALLFAAYTVLVRRKPVGLSQTAFLGFIFPAGLIMLAPFAALELVLFGPPPLGAAVVGSILYVGLGASLAAFFLWNRAIAGVGPAGAGVVYYSLPLFTGIEAWLILGEPVTIIHLVSGLLIIGGIFLAARY